MSPVYANKVEELLGEIPGHFELRMAVHTEDSIPPYAGLTDRVGQPSGYTFEQMARRIGGRDGYLIDALGSRHPVSLAAWSEMDVHVRFFPTFYFKPDPGFEERYQALLRKHAGLDGSAKER